MWYDSTEYDSLYNIKCCDTHIRTYRSSAFRKWNKMNKEDPKIRNQYDEQFHYNERYGVYCPKCNKLLSNGWDDKGIYQVCECGKTYTPISEIPKILKENKDD